MNLEDQKKTGTNQINVSDSLEAPLLNIKVKRTSSTTIPSSNDLIVYVDTSPKSNPTSNRKQFVFELTGALGMVGSTSDEFILEATTKKNDIVSSAYVIRRVSGNNVLSTPIIEEVGEALITLFEGTNYIYTNYTNDYIELIYPKNDEFNKRYLNNALFAYYRINSSGDFSLDDIYFKDAFTKTENKLNFEVDNAEIESLTSKNNKFSLDANGNLVVNSISSNSGQLLNLDLIYPVGCIYMSVNSANPSALFGGTWQAFGSGKCLIGLDANDNDFNLSEKTGGSKTHSHVVNSHSHSSGSITACIGSPTGNSFGLGFAATTPDGPNSSYSVGGNTAYASGHPGRSHNTITTGNTGDASPDTNTADNLPPYVTVYMWKRTV